MKEALKITLKGIGGFFLCFFIGKVLMTFGWMIATCFATILAGIILSTILYSKRSSSASLMTSIFGMIFAGLIPAIKTNHYGFGKTENLISVQKAKASPFITFYSFTDAYVESELDAHKSIYGRKGKIGDVFVAPVVWKGWNKHEEVTAWAVSEIANDELWKINFRKALQVLDNDDARKAIEKAVGKYGLKSSQNAVLLYWTNDPDDEWKWEQIYGLLAPAIISIIWIIVHLSTYNYIGPIVEEKKTTKK